MTLRVAVQMDPLSSLNIAGDSTLALMAEAQKRGHILYHYLAPDLSYNDGMVGARAVPVRLDLTAQAPFTIGEARHLTLQDDVDVVLMRQDPPFDLAYITATHLLEMVHPRVLVVNNPTSVRNAPEKLFVTRFRDFMPPTLITRSLTEVQAFRQEHGALVLKPLYGNAGAAVFCVLPEDPNLSALVELFQATDRAPFIVQKFIPDVAQGDKRIILIEGEVAGAINRRPKAGEIRSNLAAGGMAEPTDLTARDLEICAALRDDLQALGLVFVGIDVIAGYLTEINVTSPTGIRAIDRYHNANLAGLIWDAIERRRAT